ncbi:MAG: hypothetical protein ACR2OW_12910 [Methyloligellaceae bacterium]
MNVRSSRATSTGTTSQETRVDIAIRFPIILADRNAARPETTYRLMSLLSHAVVLNVRLRDFDMKRLVSMTVEDRARR